MGTAPELDGRSADDVIRDMMRRLERNVSEWTERVDPETGEPSGAGGSLVAAFARLMEILIDRLNRAPDNNFLAFLDMLGVSRTPPRAARVPLVFTLVSGGPGRTTIPEGTRVAAEPLEEGGDPPVFETERRLEAVAATLDSLGVRDPVSDRYAIRTPTNGLLPDPPILFRGDVPTSHALYIRHDELLCRGAEEIRLEFDIVGEMLPRDRPRVRWCIWDGDDGLPLLPSLDGTHGLARSGAVELRDVPEAPLQIVNGVMGRWLRVSLEGPVAHGRTSRKDAVRAAALPVVQRIGIRQELSRADSEPEAGFADTVPLDLSKDFFPFGEAPRFGSTFYLSQEEAFAISGGRVTLHVEVTNSVIGGLESPLPRTRPSPDLRLRWEAWNGEMWEELGLSTPSDEGAGEGFQDTTKALSQSGRVAFTLPRRSAATEVNGTFGHWIRARVAAGGYGRPPSYRAKDGEKGQTEFELVPGTLAPPALRSVSIERVAIREAGAPQTALACNDSSWIDGTDRLRAPTESWRPFSPMEDREPALYLGLRIERDTSKFPGRSLSLWLDLEWPGGGGAHPTAAVIDSIAETRGAGRESRVAWEYWGPGGWTTLAVEDETEGLRRSGIVRLIVPQDFIPKTDFGLPRHWLRAVLIGEDREAPSRLLRSAVSNAVWASHAVSVRDETLGSSNGTPGQQFRTRLSPVLPGQRLLVRERSHPSHEKEALDGDSDQWAAWDDVPDLHGSGPADRHYVLDRLCGEIRFGDGRRGSVPPAGRANVRMSFYRSGGGSSGNVPPESLGRLLTTVPYVADVTNPPGARGGAEAEGPDEVRRRAQRGLRHGNRAVAAADYEDLAREATQEVARVRCLRGDDRSAGFGGRVRIVVVPRSAEPAPVPDDALLSRVARYLEDRCPAGMVLDVRGPAYLRVGVEATLAIAAPELAGTVEATAVRALQRFLHPLSGGRGGDGLPFGRVPERSDFLALLASLPGVERIESLTLTPDEPPSRSEAGGLLVRSGTLRIHTVLALKAT